MGEELVIDIDFSRSFGFRWGGLAGRRNHWVDDLILLRLVLGGRGRRGTGDGDRLARRSRLGGFSLNRRSDDGIFNWRGTCFDGWTGGDRVCGWSLRLDR